MRRERDDPVALVELMMLVSLGLRPSLHAGVKKMAQLPATLAALYEKVKRTELQVLRARVQASAARLEPVVVLAHRIYDLHPGAALRRNPEDGSGHSPPGHRHDGRTLRRCWRRVSGSKAPPERGVRLGERLRPTAEHVHHDCRPPLVSPCRPVSLILRNPCDDSC